MKVIYLIIEGASDENDRLDLRWDVGTHSYSVTECCESLEEVMERIRVEHLFDHSLKFRIVFG